MPFYDLPEKELKQYLPAREEPGDFDEFWADTLTDARRFPLNAVFEEVDHGLRHLVTYDVTFAGYDGEPVKGWLLVPRDVKGPLPCVLEYIGYGGGRGFPTDWLVWSAAGYAHFIMDTRGQGSAWLPGDTPDREPVGSSPQFPGFMTRGVYDPASYYYRRLMTDAVRAIEAARSHDSVDAEMIAVHGISQGGGLCIAAAGLDQSIKAVMTNVPFLCHYRRATEITDVNPYEEIAHFLRIHRNREADVFRTLSYFDGLNFAVRARGAALFAVGLMDDICPPSTVYAAYNHYAGPKDIRVYRYNYHDGGGTFHIQEELRFLSGVFA